MFELEWRGIRQYAHQVMNQLTRYITQIKTRAYNLAFQLKVPQKTFPAINISNASEKSD